MAKRSPCAEVEAMHTLLNKWKTQVSSYEQWYFTSQATPIIKAHEKGWKVAVCQAQAWKRGLKEHFGFDARRGVFLTPEAKSHISTTDDLVAFMLHMHCYIASREMIIASAWLINTIQSPNKRSGKQPLDYNAAAAYALMGVWEKLMESFIPCVLVTLQRGRGQSPEELFNTFVRASITHTVPHGRAKGKPMRWAQALHSLHPDLPFEAALDNELCGEIWAALSEITSPVLLSLLPGKVTWAIEKIGEQGRLEADQIEFCDNAVNSYAEFDGKASISFRVEWEALGKSTLSQAEQAVFVLMLDDFQVDEIAALRQVNPSTIYSQQESIRKKMALAQLAL